MPSPELRRAVLSNAVTRDDIDAAVERCSARMTNVIPGSAEIPAQLIFSSADGGHVFMIEDQRLGVVYVAASDAAGGALLAKVAGELPVLGDEVVTQLETALESSADPSDDIRLGLATLVLHAPTAPSTPRILSLALRHPHENVRRFALLASTYAPSRALYAALAHIRDGDEVPELRDQAKRILAAILDGAS